MRLFTGVRWQSARADAKRDRRAGAEGSLTMLGVTGDGSLIIRRATPDEAACWCASAMEAGTL